MQFGISLSKSEYGSKKFLSIFSLLEVKEFLNVRGQS